MATKCKRCNSETVYWEKSPATGKWILYEEFTNQKHFCQDDKIKAVKCKYCPADDLYWAEDVDPVTQQKKMVLTESYGLQHACDERVAFVAKEKQDKKDKYAAEKKRVAAEPNGPCAKCKGYGSIQGLLCESCQGYGNFSEYHRKAILNTLRFKIWPHMRDSYQTKW